jgi:hypothetical protein
MIVEPRTLPVGPELFFQLIGSRHMSILRVAASFFRSEQPNNRIDPETISMTQTSAHQELGDWTGIERRRAKRKLVSEEVLLSLPGQITHQPCRLRDLAVYGAGLSLDRFRVVPTEFKLSFDGFRTTFACRLVWRDRVRGGVEFRP